MSVAMDTPDVKVLVVYAKTLAGIDSMAEAKELDALFTTVLVLPLTAEVTPLV